MTDGGRVRIAHVVYVVGSSDHRDGLRRAPDVGPRRAEGERPGPPRRRAAVRAQQCAPVAGHRHCYRYVVGGLRRRFTS
ncbi:MAG: hypothetical protein F4Z73_01125 [Synechococcus sp. SB0668_bin_13]|nr:hypothetical protein [Cyanobacteria bacterium MAG IRC3_bin_20]MDE0647693.1 hypothetical protein [Cyanobacteria bacterium MAG IRC4_bin_6]MXW11486.1 hypothetical protein [Synechococcus sp. SB0668_bin_13]MYK06383.1 hypothetical protein [Synechococcus sp. SB0670_bin_20]MYK86222.1 hypothetical protein [Synechococcus sp. SB0669_bin_7]